MYPQRSHALTRLAQAAYQVPFPAADLRYCREYLQDASAVHNDAKRDAGVMALNVEKSGETCVPYTESFGVRMRITEQQLEYLSVTLV